MPRVQYSHPQRRINQAKSIQTPMREGLKPWLLAARKVFPDAPASYVNTEQLLTTSSICLKFECMETGDRYAFVIER